MHIPEKGHVTTRYYGWYANRPRGMRVKAAPVAMDGPPTIVRAPRLAPSEATRRWAALLQQIFKVDPLDCPTCHSALRIVAFITQASVIDQILAHLCLSIRKRRAIDLDQRIFEAMHRSHFSRSSMAAERYIGSDAQREARLGAFILMHPLMARSKHCLDCEFGNSIEVRKAGTAL